MMILLAQVCGICAVLFPLLLMLKGLCLLVRGFRKGANGVLMSAVALFTLCLLALVSSIILRETSRALLEGSF